MGLAPSRRWPLSWILRTELAPSSCRFACHNENAPEPPRIASRTTLCLASSRSSAGHPLGVPRRELFRDGAPRLHANPVPVFMRPLTISVLELIITEAQHLRNSITISLHTSREAAIPIPRCESCIMLRSNSICPNLPRVGAVRPVIHHYRVQKRTDHRSGRTQGDP